MWPDDPTLLSAWRELVADPTTAGRFAGLVLEPLTTALGSRRRFRFADPADISDAAEMAVLAFLKNASRYDPARAPLARYLEFIAGRKLNSLLSGGAKHRVGRIPWDSVELDVPARNEEEEDDAPSFDAPEMQAVIAGFTPPERAVFELLLAGERSTSAFAVVLGLAALPTEEQEAGVKRVKDRIKARFKRAVGGDHHD